VFTRYPDRAKWLCSPRCPPAHYTRDRFSTIRTRYVLQPCNRDRASVNKFALNHNREYHVGFRYCARARARSQFSFVMSKISLIRLGNILLRRAVAQISLFFSCHPASLIFREFTLCSEKKSLIRRSESRTVFPLPLTFLFAVAQTLRVRVMRSGSPSPRPPPMNLRLKGRKRKERGNPKESHSSKLEYQSRIHRRRGSRSARVWRLSLSLSACAREPRFIPHRKYTDRPSELARNILTGGGWSEFFSPTSPAGRTYRRSLTDEATRGRRGAIRKVGNDLAESRAVTFSD